MQQFVAVHVRPVDCHTVRPQPSGGGQHRLHLTACFTRMRQRRADTRCPITSKRESRQRRQCIAWPDFQQLHRRIGSERRDAIGEQHCTAQVRYPVVSRRRFLGANPGAGEVGDVRSTRRRERHARDQRAERHQRRFHHRGMKCVRRVQRTMFDSGALEILRQRFDIIARARHRAQRRCVDGGDLSPGTQSRPQIGRRQTHRQHITRRHALHQMPPRRHQHQRILERKDARQMRRHVFANAVTEHGRRLNAPRHPQHRQRVFGHEQHRLRNVRLTQIAVAAVPEQLTHVTPEVRMQQLGATIHRGAKHMLRAVQLRAHSGVLTALAAEQKCHRSRSTFMHTVGDR